MFVMFAGLSAFYYIFTLINITAHGWMGTAEQGQEQSTAQKTKTDNFY